MDTLVKNIKRLAEEQKYFKNQKKTVNLIGERKIDPWEATYSHAKNRYELRHLNIALGLLRGKTIEQIESNPKSLYEKHKVDNLMDIHKNEFVHEE